jgi:hypothetical protein
LLRFRVIQDVLDVGLAFFARAGEGRFFTGDFGGVGIAFGLLEEVVVAWASERDLVTIRFAFAAIRPTFAPIRCVRLLMLSYAGFDAALRTCPGIQLDAVAA